MMRKFAAAKVEDIIKSIPMPVYAPIEENGMVQYGLYEEGAKLNLDTCKTEKSPKDLLFPQWEDMMHFRMEGKTISITEQERCSQDYVLFGARACDLKAFEVLDRVFLADPVDTYYAARRAHGITVAMACGNPEDSCFCTVFGIDPANPTADLVLWKAGEEYYAEAQTKRGEELMANWETEEADAAAVEPVKAEITKKISEKPFANLDLTGLDGDHMMEMFNSPQWKKLSLACLGCGSCTFVCPTCQCYDIRDYDSGSDIQRYRCWDSCMYSDFTLMAHGTNRPTQVERYRQRFMHKLCYYPANNEGLYSCVGCGRCVRKCPMNLNIVKVIKALGEEKR
jgi:ferredoxin